MIHELKDPAKAEHLFAGWEETLIWSCLQGVMGSVFVTDPDHPVSALAFVGCFGFYAGEPDRELVENKPGGFVIMVPQDEAKGRLVSGPGIRAQNGEAELEHPVLLLVALLDPRKKGPGDLPLVGGGRDGKGLPLGIVQGDGCPSRLPEELVADRGEHGLQHIILPDNGEGVEVGNQVLCRLLWEREGGAQGVDLGHRHRGVAVGPCAEDPAVVAHQVVDAVAGVRVAHQALFRNRADPDPVPGDPEPPEDVLKKCEIAHW